jgi:uncharacterized protein
MKIRIEEITEKGIQLGFNKEKEWLDELFRGGRDIDFTFASPISISLMINRSGRNVFVQGKIDTSLNLKCIRCAEEFVYHLSEAITCTLAPLIETSRPHSESELTSQDLELSFYQGEEIDLYQILKEHLFLSLPSYPLCSNSCKGLCPVCGVNLNVDSCRCSQRVGNFPLSVIGR